MKFVKLNVLFFY